MSEEMENEEVAISQLKTTETTIYVLSQKDHINTIKQVMENYDMAVLRSNLDVYSENLLSGIDVQLQEIALKNATIYASMKINEFKKENDQIRGIYLNGYLFNNPSKRESIEKILTNTDVNTLVIDVKTDNGHILFDTEIDEVIYLNNERVKFTNNDLQELREIKDIYLVGRLVVFQDPLFAKVFPNEAVFDSRLNKPYSQNGQFFLDPSSKKVQDYIINIAIESCRLGFDEIQYDYIRYPDSNSKFMQFDTKNDFENRVNNINSFLSRSRQLLHNEGCLLSADTFGYILTNKQDGGIGQNLETIVENVDFISPMVYPSHYTNGSFGYQNPNEHPYEVITAALTDALDRGVDKDKIRPFLQGFWHSNEDIRNNIRAASDLEMDWLIWNILSVYELDSFTKLSE
ncbi:putative glycoside hydrolase [Candidatus Actinomarina]|nr:putative glycoside hydrolase [bacterium]MDA9685765.1 putative glycoside hydrolase [Candidatus Actinomarina sp.]